MNVGVKRQLALTRALVLTPFKLIEDAVILISNEKIVAVGPGTTLGIPSGFREIDLEGLIIAPGLIDQHLHGGGGVEVMQGKTAALADLARFNATHGITAFLATTMAAPETDLQAVARSFATLVGHSYQGARCLGLHLEGPYLAAGRAGVHRTDCLRPPSLAELERLQKSSNTGIKMVTLAPELPGALEVAEVLDKEGIVCSIGHSDADYEMTCQATESGFICVTHCFNGLRPWHHRDPGTVGAALTTDALTAEVIADGVHLHPAALELLWRAKGVQRLILVSDGMAPAGCGDGLFATYCGPLRVKGGRLTTATGNLAGSNLTLEQTVKNFWEFTSCELTDAFRMATYNPAKLLGIEADKGSLAPGKDADLIALTPEFDVVLTMVGGEIISGLIAV
ncbi:MAG: N-acetylglucosamine-6-phosphate deacetylase [Bacillota bacterium]|jgi:N-acetylglucosamine-6-phosphate deacetylase